MWLTIAVDIGDQDAVEVLQRTPKLLSVSFIGHKEQLVMPLADLRQHILEPGNGRGQLL